MITVPTSRTRLAIGGGLVVSARARLRAAAER